MRIKTINIMNFGKFQDFTLNFNQQAQIFYGDNEAGKTTIMSFILMMLYGDQGRGGKKNTTIRRLYSPWNGGKMGGSMEFESEGVDYRVEKQFADTFRKDTVRLLDLTNDKEVPLADKEEVGQHVLGMTQESFKKTGFVQMPGAISGSEKDEVTSRLVKNLAQTGEEDVSADTIVSRLEQAKFDLVSRNEKKGELVDARNQLLHLQQEKRDAEQLLDQQSDTVKQLRVLDSQRTERESVKRALSSKNTADQVNQRVQLLNALGAAETAEDNLSSYPVEIAQIPEFLNQAKHAQSQAELDVSALRSNAHGDTAYTPLDESDVVKAQQTSKQLESLTNLHQRLDSFVVPAGEKVKQGKADNQQLQDQLQAAEKEARDTAVDADAYEKADTAARQASRDIEALQSRLNDDGMRSGREQPKQGSKLPLVGGVLTVIGIVLGIIAGALGYVVAVVGVGLAIFGVMQGRETGSSTQSSRDEAAELEQRQQAKAAAEKDKAQYLRGYQKNRDAIKRQQTLHIQIDALKETQGQDQDEWQRQLSAWNGSASDFKLPVLNLENMTQVADALKQRQQTLSQELAQILAAHQAKSVEELAGRLEAQKLQKQNIAHYQELKQTAQVSTAALLKLFAQFEPAPETINQTAQLIEQLTNAWKQYSSAADRVKNQRDVTGLRDTKEQLKQYIENAGKQGQQEPVNVTELEGKLKSFPADLDDQFYTLQSQITSPAHSLDEYESMIAEQGAVVDQLQARYDAAVIANQVLGDTLEQRRQNFAPELRQLVGEYLDQLTHGRYDSVMIPKTYALQVESQGQYREYRSLSSGTLDQAYLALRVAFTNLLAPRDQEGIPILLDDVLREYDESRVKKAFEFLLSQTEQHQIILFTCHAHLKRLGEEEGFVAVDL